MSSGTQPGENIKVLIVDDIPDTRENLRKLLAFESDIEVVGGSGAGTGREAIALAVECKPDVILMDINMPDMDGITATKAINEAVRTAAVVIISVQSEPEYLRQAMLAGARDYLTKPISSEELYSTIRRVYDRNAPFREQEAQSYSIRSATQDVQPNLGLPMVGAGHVIVVYSPQAGAGVTTLATNIASALMQPDTRVLLMDCNLQFGDVDAFLNLQSRLNISDLTKNISDVDQDVLENVLVTHGSGLKVLVAPPRPEQAYDVIADDVQGLVTLLTSTYDFIIIDTPTQYDDLTLKLFDVAERIVLVANPTLPSIRNTRKILDVFDTMQDTMSLLDKVLFVLNRVVSEKEQKGRGIVPTASIEAHLKHKVICSIPLDERAVLTAVNQGVPLVAKSKTRSPGREMVQLADMIHQAVADFKQIPDAPVDSDSRTKGGGIRSLFGGTG